MHHQLFQSINQTAAAAGWHEVAQGNCATDERMAAAAAMAPSCPAEPLSITLHVVCKHAQLPCTPPFAALNPCSQSPASHPSPGAADHCAN